MAWLNEYHAAVWDKVSPGEDEEVKMAQRSVQESHGEDGYWMRAKIWAVIIFYVFLEIQSITLLYAAILKHLLVLLELDLGDLAARRRCCRRGANAGASHAVFDNEGVLGLEDSLGTSLDLRA